MADDVTQGRRAPEAEEEGQAGAAANEGAAGGSGRRRALRFAGLGLASFLISGLAALVAGGHFSRPPLSSLRGVPVLGKLIPAPPETPRQKPEEVPTMAKLHPMPAAEISGLIQNLQGVRDGYTARLQEVARQEDRVRALQLDLQRERDLLEQFMATLTKRQDELQAGRKALETDTIVARAEERKRLVKLAKIYEAQAPTAAAAELASLDGSAKDGLAAKIIAEMQEKKAAAVFDAMKPEAALALKGKISTLRYEQNEAGKEATP